jgi:acyl-[acyl-carrier-protein]-phospholipid O-acyltransferase/long-chain-fatty-acid--[acyl-carrier-protein] ligase
MSKTETDIEEPAKRQWLGFWSMIVQQTQNAFNDKMAQFILIPLGGAVGVAVESWAGLMISLPFVLFAPLAGWLSDRFSKRIVLFYSAVLQLLVLIWICAAVMMGNIHVALCGFFALAVQSAFFSPAKMGLNKELLGSRHLGFATAVQQMLAMLAMLTGQIVAGKLFDDRYKASEGTVDAAWQAALGPLGILALCSIPALAMAWLLPPVSAQSTEKFRPGLLFGHFHSLRDLWSDRSMRWASFGVAFFWGFAAYLNLWSVKLAKVLTDGGEGFGSLSSLFMAAASLGMAVGFGFASWLLRRTINLGWVPLAALLMALSSLVLAVMPISGKDGFLAFVTLHPATLTNAAVAEPGCAGFLLTLGCLAFFSALFLAPLNAWMQDRYPADKRGEMQSAVNLQDCFAGIAGVIVITGLELGASAMGISPLDGLRPHMLLIAALCLAAGILIVRLLPADFLRLIGSTVVRMFYRIETVHAERLPAKGGVLLLPNHVTFADSFFLSTALQRPVRFVMDEGFTKNKVIRVFTGIFDTVTIRRDQPIEAIRTVIAALHKGEVLCLFPEGQLTRTGMLCPLMRGFELIARKAGHPLIPIWMDGAWGSVFSYEGGRYFRKKPRSEVKKLILALAEPLHPDSVSLDGVNRRLWHASADAIGQRFAGKSWSTRIPKAPSQIRRSFASAETSARLAFWANGHQIGMTHAIPRRQPWHVLKRDPCALQLLGLFATFPALFQTPIRWMDDFDGTVGGVWAGGDTLRKRIRMSQITVSLVFHDFSAEAAARPLERADVLHCPALAIQGQVISLSMPDMPAAPGFEPQKGHRIHTWGRLLPGWALDYRDTIPFVRGPAGELPLPPGMTVDEDGFLIDPSAKPRTIRAGRRA